VILWCMLVVGDFFWRPELGDVLWPKFGAFFGVLSVDRRLRGGES
jgi:hypothetical protein